MSMKKSTDPRRIYIRADQFLVCFSGKYFGKGRKASKLDPGQPIVVTVLTPSGGKRRVQVAQGEVIENWREQNIVFTPHTAKIPTNQEGASPQ